MYLNNQHSCHVHLESRPSELWSADIQYLTQNCSSKSTKRQTFYWCFTFHSEALIHLCPVNRPALPCTQVNQCSQLYWLCLQQPNRFGQRQSCHEMLYLCAVSIFVRLELAHPYEYFSWLQLHHHSNDLTRDFSGVNASHTSVEQHQLMNLSFSHSLLAVLSTKLLQLFFIDIMLQKKHKKRLNGSISRVFLRLAHLSRSEAPVRFSMP